MSVYFIRHPGCGSIKIGNARVFANRLAELQCAASAKLEVLLVIDGDRRLEKSLHHRFYAHRRFGEWFAPADHLTSFIAALAAADAREREVLCRPQAKPKLVFDREVERALIGAYLITFIAKHGKAVTQAVAGIGPQMIGLIMRGGLLGALRINRLYAFDPSAFGSMLRGVSEGARIDAAIRALTALKCRCEKVRAA